MLLSLGCTCRPTGDSGFNMLAQNLLNLPPPPPQALHAGDLLDPHFSLHWERCRDCPVGSWNGQPMWFNGKLYLGGGGGGFTDAALLSVYTPSEDSWEVIRTPTSDYVLTIYHSQLLLVGGDRYTSSRAYRVWVLEDHHWVPHPTIPGLPVRWSVLNAIGFGDYLIVHVRETVFSYRTTLTVWNGQHWFTVASPQLPAVAPWSKEYAVNRDDWYLSGGGGIVYRVSLQSVVSSALSRGAQPAPVWERLPDPPHGISSITWFRGHLLAVGGYSRQTVTNKSPVHAYNQQARSWEHVSDFPGDGCHGCSCAAHPTGELLVVGGWPIASRVLKATIRDRPCVCYCVCVVFGSALQCCVPKIDRAEFDKGYHRREHLKRSKLVQISAP